MRKTTAPAAGAIPAQPGPQDAAESTNGVIPGAGPTGDRLTPRPGPRPAPRPASGPTEPSAGRLREQHPDLTTGPAAATGRPEARGTGQAVEHTEPVGTRDGDGSGGPGEGIAEPGTERLVDGPDHPAAERATLRLRGRAPADPGHPDVPSRHAPERVRLRESADPVGTRDGDGSGRSGERNAGRGPADRAGAGDGDPTAQAARTGTVCPTDGPDGPDGPSPSAVERATLRLREAVPTEAAPVDADPGGPGRPDEPPRYAPAWLRLREPADAAARAHDLLDPLRIRLANLPSRADGLVVHDLGCGTGSMGRWLAPLLDGAQHWVLHDRDPYLLHFAAVGAPRSAADGSRVTVETRRGDLARLTPDALAGAGLVTASALLDVLTAEEVGTLAAACAAAGCPALLTLSVAGRVELAPAHPLDAEIAEAFNDHQRRTGLLGPDAVTSAAEAFAAHGATVRAHPSPWRLGPGEAALAEQWLRGWVGAAVEQRPELREPAGRYLEERLAACAAGELRVVVHHTDLLALCRPTGGSS